MGKFKIVNEFGIMPSKSYMAAGYDFYLPIIKNVDTKEKVMHILEIFSDSYGLNIEELIAISNFLALEIQAQKEYDDVPNDLLMNALHLYLGLRTFYTESNTNWFSEDAISQFVEHKLILENNKIGISCKAGDSIKFNSGIKTKFENSQAGIFFNKSGKGSIGWDVMACVIDEDYTGFLHINMNYTNSYHSSEIYCGDKLTQLIIFDLPKVEIEEISESDFTNEHSKSLRGSNGFGSTDVKG